jgi:hypothetical protein
VIQNTQNDCCHSPEVILSLSTNTGNLALD